MTMRFQIPWVGPFEKPRTTTSAFGLPHASGLAVIRQSPSVRRVRLKTIGWPPWQSVQSTRPWQGKQVKAAVS